MRVGSAAARPLGLLLGYGADLVLGDPWRWHPVAGFGRTAAALERRTYRDSLAAGALHTGALVAASVAAGALAQRAARGPVARTALTAAATWAVLGGRSLRREATAVGALLDSGDLPGARRRITHLVGRNPESLDEAGLARACVESVAENTSDAVVAPLLWGALAGVPGLVGYRAVNTLDAMIGHRSPRYERFGWAAARLDDLANLLPARLSAVIAAAAAPAVGGTTAAAVRAVRRDAGRHPSPNAGPVEAAFAGSMGRTLGGINTYDSTIEDRGTLGEGPPPEIADIQRAVRLSAVVGGVACAVVVVAAAVGTQRDAGRRLPFRLAGPSGGRADVELPRTACAG
ncbi:MAG TPA: cobalamin biosynthesis protein [Nakamurella sp.]